MDRRRCAASTDGDHRGAPAGRARAPVPGRRARQRRPPPAARRSSPRPTASCDPTPRPRASTRAAAATAGWRGRPRTPAAHARPRRDRRAASRRGAMLPGDRVRLQPRRLRPGGRAVPRRRAAAHRRRPSASAIRAHRRRAHRRRSPTTTSTCSATTQWLAGLEAGFAAHHAGMVPPMKEAVEEAFAAGLVKVVFATETLALGINMPARSVVIEKLSKFTGEHHEFLTPGEYTQLTGRAGRRGIDDRGLRRRAAGARSCRSTRSRRARVAAHRTRSRRRSARPTTWPPTSCAATTAIEAHHLLNLSFAQFHADRDVVALERQLDRDARAARAPARGRRGERPRRRRASTGALTAELDAAARDRGGRPRIAEALDALRPGDVVIVRRARRAGRRAQARAPARRRQPRCSRSRRVATLVRLGPDDFDGPARQAAHDRPARARSRRATRRSARQAADAPAPGEAPRRRRDGRDATTRGSPSSRRSSPRTRSPTTRSSRAAAAGRGGGRAPRTRRRRARAPRARAAARAWPASSTACSRVLEAWGYVDGWALTDGGRAAGPALHRDRPRVAEALRDGLLDGLAPPELAALVSCFTYERRGPDGQRADAAARAGRRKPVAQRARAIERIWRDLQRQRGRRRPARDPRARSRASRRYDARLGARATSSPTCSTTTR